MKVTKRVSGVTMMAVTLFLTICACDLAFAQEAVKAAVNPDVTRWAFLAAAISTGLSALAAGIAVAYVGAAAVGAVSEKPEMAGRALIFVGLAEGIAIYGLIIAIMILGKV
ncbi:MAG: ATP synthase subunit C [Candidatus Omnitrophota bacterium]